jgi:hypothetical protein
MVKNKIQLVHPRVLPRKDGMKCAGKYFFKPKQNFSQIEQEFWCFRQKISGFHDRTVFQIRNSVSCKHVQVCNRAHDRHFCRFECARNRYPFLPGNDDFRLSFFLRWVGGPGLVVCHISSRQKTVFYPQPENCAVLGPVWHQRIVLSHSSGFQSYCRYTSGRFLWRVKAANFPIHVFCLFVLGFCAFRCILGIVSLPQRPLKGKFGFEK